MPVHEVKQGETIASIARQYGIADWRAEVYDHPNNRDLKLARDNPNVLFPGDTVWVPDPESKREPGVTNRRHRFRLKGESQWLLVILRDVNEKPIVGAPYTLEVEGQKWEGQTTGAGLVQHEIPVGAQQGTLTVRGAAGAIEQALTLKIGHLDPVDTTTGWKARLNNLGYDAGREDAPQDLQSRSAVEEFQCDEEIRPLTWRVDAPTQGILKFEHGS